MDLIQTNGQPRFGRFSVVPSMINIDRYEYRTVKGETLTGWRKRFKYKKYKFCSIQHEHYTIGLAIADVSWAGYGFFYIYNNETHDVMNWSAVNFLSRKTVLDEQPLFNQSYFHNSPFQIQIEHANGVRYIQLTKFGEIQLSARIFCAGTQPLSLCKPSGLNGWIYTQQLMTLNCEGYFLNKSGQIIQFNDQSFASLNDACGFSQSDTSGLKLFSNFRDKNNHRIGINLCSNHTEEELGENCVWINRQLYFLPEVHIKQIEKDIWHIGSFDQTVDLMIKLGWRRSETLNLRWLNNQINHWQVKISGQIILQKQVILFLDEYGLFEQQEVKS